jgi:outer membrane protein OmpA-like peptidoglycan-associated protein
MKKIPFVMLLTLTAVARAETDGGDLSAEELAARLRTEAPKAQSLPPGLKTRGWKPAADERKRSGAISGNAYGKTRSAIDLYRTRAIGANPGTPVVTKEMASPSRVEVQCSVSAVTEVSFRLQFNLNSDTFVDPVGAGRDLDKIAVALKSFEKPNAATLSERIPVQFLVEGHTCDLGEEATNQVLSERRALAVREHLLTRGVPPEMLLVLGQGEARPVGPNDTEAHRALNRRVVVAKVADSVASAK